MRDSLYKDNKLKSLFKEVVDNISLGHTRRSTPLVEFLVEFLAHGRGADGPAGGYETIHL